MFCFALGTIAVPYTAPELIEACRPSDLFLLIETGQGTLRYADFTILVCAPLLEVKTRYVYAPHNGFILRRLLKQPREEKYFS